MTDKSLFVFYTINPETRTKQWVYPRFPTGWKWIGGGTVNPVHVPIKNNVYELEEQFQGPISHRQEMREVIDGIFQNLRQKGIVVRYKIRNTYLP